MSPPTRCVTATRHQYAQRLAASAADASISAHMDAASTARAASDAPSSGAPVERRITRAASRRGRENAVPTHLLQVVEGADTVGTVNGSVLSSAPRADTVDRMAVPTDSLTLPSLVTPPTSLSAASTDVITSSLDVSSSTLSDAGDDDTSAASEWESDDFVPLSALPLPSPIASDPPTVFTTVVTHDDLPSPLLSPLAAAFSPAPPADHVSSPPADFLCPSPTPVPLIGPQRESAPACVVAPSQDGLACTGPTPPATDSVSGACATDSGHDGKAERRSAEVDGNDAGDGEGGSAAEQGQGEPCVLQETSGGAEDGQVDATTKCIEEVLYSTPSAPSGLPRSPLRLPDFDGLAATPYPVYTMGAGRCSIAAPMLAIGALRDGGSNQHVVARVDAERIRLGDTMQEPAWSEDRWIRTVPIALRMERTHTGWHRDESLRTTPRTSYEVLRGLLRDPAENKKWMEPSIFYLTAELYAVGVFVVQTAAVAGTRVAYFRHIRPSASQHIVIYFDSGHYECVQYQQQRVFRSTHELVQRLLQLCITQPPPVVKEVDLDLQIVAERATQPQLAERVTQPQPMPAAPPVTPPPAEARPARRSSRAAAAATALTPAKSEVHSLTPPSIPMAQARRSLSLLEPRSASGKAGRGGVQMRATPVQPTASRSQAVRRALSTVPVAGTPLSPADVAAHGPLYDNISFGNIPQWVAMCTLPFNAYRLASQRNDRAAQNQAVEDILMLPQRVLTRTSRGGGDGKRLTRTIRARCRARGEELRRKYQCMPPRDDTAQLRGKGETEPLVHRAAAAEPPAPLNAQAEQSSARDVAQAELSPDASSNAATNESSQADNDADGDDGGDDYDGDYARAFTQAANGMPVDPDRKAAKRAQWQVKRGHMQHAARTLHSTATMADLRSEQVRQAVELLHPALPATSVIPPLPADAPQQILEDDEEMVTLLRRSDNGSASGPSGWGGNMLSSLAQSDLCRAGIIALLKDIINGNLPDRARELLLASRLVALTKAVGKYRPIAVGELFPRLAGKLAMNKVTSAAAALLAPHQLGVGVPCGAERVVHTLQHTLTDVNSKHALLTLLSIIMSFASISAAAGYSQCDSCSILRAHASTWYCSSACFSSTSSACSTSSSSNFCSSSSSLSSASASSSSSCSSSCSSSSVAPSSSDLSVPRRLKSIAAWPASTVAAFSRWMATATLQSTWRTI